VNTTAETIEREGLAPDKLVKKVKKVLGNWPYWSQCARECALEVFDSAKNLQKMLEL